ncbi:metal-dependent hydrolase [Methylomonas koyamae]|uniref:Metal-dependent hydrolase n=1 Tax=Methylomonas koyamae TaxID=702114 RepID=A0A177NPF7_9GAMM|nr:metal-dependent hydrolase [Methylomonas koyamae]
MAFLNAPSYTLRRSSRAKHTRIVVKAGQIEVVAPPKVSERNIHSFVLAQRDWIESALRRVAAKTREVPALAPASYHDGVAIPYLGRQLPLRIETTRNKTPRLDLHDDAWFCAKLPAGIDAGQHSELVRQTLIRWMKSRARQHAQLFVDRHAPRHGLYPRSIRIKTQKSRWGSCGPDNDINLNWLLLLAPPAALEYVVVHELCHIRHKNHSAAFWELVAEHVPDFRQRRLWLKQHGASLMQGL